MTTEPPMTRSEVREEIDRSLRFYATKEDLANMKSDLQRFVLANTLAILGLGAGFATLIVRLAD